MKQKGSVTAAVSEALSRPSMKRKKSRKENAISNAKTERSAEVSHTLAPLSNGSSMHSWAMRSRMLSSCCVEFVMTKDLENILDEKILTDTKNIQ